MPRGPDVGKLELWRRWLREFERGSETVAAFCRRIGTSPATFYGWRRRVARLAGETSRLRPRARGAVQNGGNGPSPLSFLPVQITSQPRSVVEVLLADGTRVLVPSGDRESLRVVLEFTSGGREVPSC